MLFRSVYLCGIVEPHQAKSAFCLSASISSASYLLQCYNTKDMSTPSVYAHTDVPKNNRKMITSVLFLTSFNFLMISKQHPGAFPSIPGGWTLLTWPVIGESLILKVSYQKKSYPLPSGVPLKLLNWHVKLAFSAFFSLINTKTKYLLKKKGCPAVAVHGCGYFPCAIITGLAIEQLSVAAAALVLQLRG